MYVRVGKRLFLCKLIFVNGASFLNWFLWIGSLFWIDFYEWGLFSKPIFVNGATKLPKNYPGSTSASAVLLQKKKKERNVNRKKLKLRFLNIWHLCITRYILKIFFKSFFLSFSELLISETPTVILVQVS